MTVERVIDVQATEDAFKRMLESAFPDRPTSIDGDSMRIGEGDDAVRVQLHDQPDRQLGSLELPMERVRFLFDGQSEADADAFMEEYRTATMRTGGG